MPWELASSAANVFARPAGVAAPLVVWSPAEGEINQHEFATLAQLREKLDPAKSVWELVSDGLDLVRVGRQEVNSRSYLARYAFETDLAFYACLAVGILTGVILGLERAAGDALREVRAEQLGEQRQDVIALQCSLRLRPRPRSGRPSD